MTISPRSLRVAGWALVAYGVAGVVLLLAVLVAAGGPLGEAERLLSSLDATLDAAGDTARSTSAAMRSVQAGLEEARSGTANAGSLLAEAATTSGRLADAMGLSILGTQPLIGLADDFDSIATQLTSVGDSLARVGSALETSGSDLATVRDDVDRLAVEIERVHVRAGGDAASGWGSLRLAAFGLMAWLVLPALAALAAGAWLIRAERRIRLNRPDA